MKVIIIATILFIGFVSATDQEKLNGYVDLVMQEESAVKKHNQQEYSQWNSGLFDEILDSPNPNIRIFAIRNLIYPIENGDSESALTNKINTYKLDNFIQEILKDDSVGPQALLMLSAFCNKKINNLCDNQRLAQKLIDLEPNNIRSYVSLLDNAVKSETPSEIEAALTTIAKAQYINNHFNTQTEFTQLVQNYIEDYPAPQSHIDKNLNAFGLTELKQQYTQIELNEHLLFSTMVGIEMAIPSDNYYRLIKQACKDNLSSVQDCLKISNTLINNSYTVLSKWLGYDIQLSIHENEGNLDKYESINDQKKEFNHAYTCISNTLFPLSRSGFLVSKNFHRITSKIGAEKGEFARLRKMAELIYKDQISNGNQEAINPNSCFVS